MNMKLPYWVFTSGEKGIHGLDWGIKFASESFTDKYALDVEYRTSLKVFSLSPSLKRPEESGFLVLPFRDSEYIAGFIFPETDHGGRLNTSSVVVLIPGGIARRMTVNELLGRIWSANDVAGIARKNSEVRPDALTLAENLTVKFSANSANLKWPKRNEGYICVDGSFELLARTDEPETVHGESAPHSSKTGVIIAGVMVMAVIAGGVFMFTKPDTPPESTLPPQTQPAEFPPQTISPDHKNQIAEAKPEKSKPSESEKTIIEGVISRLESYEGTKDFMSAKSLVSFDISASMRSLPEALIDKDRIIQSLREFFGDIQPQKHTEGFMLKPDKSRLPLDEWRRKKAEIFTPITAESLKPAKSVHHDKVINALKLSEAKEGRLTLYFRTDNENIRLAASVNISGNMNPVLRLESKSAGLIPTSKSVNLAEKISEPKSTSGYRIIFEVSEQFREGANDFSNSVSEYITQHRRETD